MKKYILKTPIKYDVLQWTGENFNEFVKNRYYRWEIRGERLHWCGDESSGNIELGQFVSFSGQIHEVLDSLDNYVEVSD